MSSARAIEPDAAQPDPSRSALHILLKEHDIAIGKTPIDWQRLSDFYRRRDMQLAWVGSDADRDLALRALEDAPQEGLSGVDYHVDDLHAAVRSNPDQLARFDILLTDGLLRYAHDARVGRIAPNDVDADVDLPLQKFDAVGAVADALRTGALPQLLAALPPTHPQYARLRALLERYRAFASGAAWTKLPDHNRIRPDETGAPTLALAERLRSEHYLAEDSSPDALRAGVVSFQRTHGLEADGLVGPATLRALNISAAERVAQIEANMERWRWLPRTLESRRIEVNVPDASLRAVDSGGAVLFSRIIVGAKERPTPILRAVAVGIILNPAWDVPMDIARAEILPKLARRPRYLSEHHMVLLKPGVVRQLPGPDNALGQLKLDMPNRFSVYLHDTPARTLFARTSRDVSHGCMRVEQILPLASFSLTGDADEAVNQLKQVIATQATKRIALPAPLPIYVLYNTAWVDADGSPQFREDLYGRDQRLIGLLEGQPTGKRYAMAAATSCLPACG